METAFFRLDHIGLCNQIGNKKSYLYAWIHSYCCFFHCGFIIFELKYTLWTGSPPGCSPSPLLSSLMYSLCSHRRVLIDELTASTLLRQLSISSNTDRILTDWRTALTVLILKVVRWWHMPGDTVGMQNNMCKKLQSTFHWKCMGGDWSDCVCVCEVVCMHSWTVAEGTD